MSAHQVLGQVRIHEEPALQVLLLSSGAWMVSGLPEELVQDLQELLPVLIPIGPVLPWSGEGARSWLGQAARLLGGDVVLPGSDAAAYLRPGAGLDGEMAPGYDPGGVVHANPGD
jgi:hypothetical protein